jgi:hypothetical protein
LRRQLYPLREFPPGIKSFRFRVWATENGEVLLPEHTPDHVINVRGGHIMVTATRPRVAATVTVRIVRQLIMRGGEVLGGRCVHSSVVELDGEGVLIAGHAGAGKTSILIHLIERHGARPVANVRPGALKNALLAGDQHTPFWHGWAE